MKYRTFGNTDLEISEIGLGTWQFGGDWGQITDSVAKAVLDTAIRCGINFFDTADVYGAGRSESIIGNFLKDKNEPVFIATKLGRLEGFPDSYSLELFRRCTENSLKRLGRDCIDLTQLHCVPRTCLSVAKYSTGFVYCKMKAKSAISERVSKPSKRLLSALNRTAFLPYKSFSIYSARNHPVCSLKKLHKKA